MRRDPDLVHRIPLAIEAKTSTASQPVKLENANEQDLLNHLDLLEQEGLIRAAVHRSGSTGEVDHVAVRALAPAGHDFLAALKSDGRFRPRSRDGVTRPLGR